MNSDLQKEMIKMVDMVVKERIKSLPFNYSITGKIIEVLPNNKYKIQSGQDTFTVSGASGHIVNEVVEIAILNGDFNNKVIKENDKDIIDKINILNEEFSHKDDMKITIDAQIKSLGQNRDTSDCVEKIEGRTLVNLIKDPVKNASEWSKVDTVNGSVSVSGNILTCTNNTSGNYARYASTTACSDISNGNYYVIIVKAKSTNGKVSFYHDRITISGVFPTIPTNQWAEVAIRGIGNSATNKWTVLACDGVGTIEYDLKTLRIYKITKQEHDALTEQQLLEKYPCVSGVQSARDFELVSVGENLFDVNELVRSFGNGNISINGETITINGGGSQTNYIDCIEVEKNTDYTLDFLSNGDGNVHVYGYNSNTFLGGKETFNTKEFDKINVVLFSVNVTTFTNVMITKGSVTNKPFKQHYKSTILSKDLFPNSFVDSDKELRSLGTVKDEIVKSSEGFKLNRKIERKGMYGDYNWIFNYKEKDFHRVGIYNIINNSIDHFHASMYDYKQYKLEIAGAGSGKYAFTLEGENPKIIYINLPNNLTGWGNGYVPTTEEIKAYFLGWRMTNSNFSGLYENGDKRWEKLWCGIGEKRTDLGVDIVNSSGVYTCPTTLNDMGYTPYQLFYELATPQSYNLNKLPILTAFENGTVYYQGKKNDGTLPVSWLYPTTTLSVSQNINGTIQSHGLAINTIEKELGNLWDSLLIIADKQLTMSLITNLTTTATNVEIINKINEILNIY